MEANAVIKIDIRLKDAPHLLRKRMKLYLDAAQEIELYLAKKPHEWGRFQSQFNTHVSNVFREIMDFEKENLESGNEDRVYRLKNFFATHIQRHFLRGDLTVWSLNKPYGYAGDFKIIDEIYLNQPTTLGFDRLFDNYFQMSSISVAVRNRKEDFKRKISSVALKLSGEFQILDIASGPCRDIKELLLSDGSTIFNRCLFHCLDADERAIQYAKELLAHNKSVTFEHMNVLRIALNKNIERDIQERYDLIYSTGLFDYLDARVTVRLLSNLKRLLKPEGLLAISDVRDKFSNPSIHFMEWVGDWSLVYRTDEEFRELFLKAGFDSSDLSFSYEQQGILQYVFAKG